MKYVDRECNECERMLLRARAMLVRCEYARWQVERIRECDKQLHSLDVARADYESLKRKYMQARDFHRALRLRLRRQFYGNLRVLGEQPNEANGIEAKVEEYVRTSGNAGTGELTDTLARIHETQAKVSEQATTYCEAHNELHRVINSARDSAIMLESLALEMLQQESKRGTRQRALREMEDEEDTQLTPIGMKVLTMGKAK